MSDRDRMESPSRYRTFAPLRGLRPYSPARSNNPMSARLYDSTSAGTGPGRGKPSAHECTIPVIRQSAPDCGSCKASAARLAGGARNPDGHRSSGHSVGVGVRYGAAHTGGTGHHAGYAAGSSAARGRGGGNLLTGHRCSRAGPADARVSGSFRRCKAI